MGLQPLLTAAAGYGLVARGGFVVTAEDEVPAVTVADAPLASSAPAKYLLLFGNTGSSIWHAFSNSDEYRDRQPNPLNRWSARIGAELAERFGGRALFPFDTFDNLPCLPFLRWGKKAERLANSQLGMLIHPQYGLWHAYRFALAFAGMPDDSLTAAAAVGGGKNLCGECASKPCLGACPVNAFTAAGYDAQNCFRYLRDNPDSRCMRSGCQARVACPHGSAYRYHAPHAAFHMRAFVTAMSAGEFGDVGG